MSKDIVVIDDWESLIESMGYSIVKMERYGSYQGELYVVLRRDDQLAGISNYGFLNIGYGSCSGCDVLEGMYLPAEDDETLSQLVKIRESERADIKWFTSSKGLLNYLKDPVGGPEDYFRREEEYQEFVKEVEEILK